MSQPTGGLRRRLIRQSLYNMLHDALAARGWFDSGRQHSPIIFNAEPVDPNEAVALNTIALADSNEGDHDWELGSRLAEHRTLYFIDFFAEDDAIGLDVAGDLKDILEGRIDAIGRSNNVFDVYDFTQVSPPVIFTCFLENVARDRAVTWAKPHQKFWYSLRLDVVDYYGAEDE